MQVKVAKGGHYKGTLMVHLGQEMGVGLAVWSVDMLPCD